MRKAERYNTIAWWITAITGTIGIAGATVGLIAANSDDQRGLMWGGLIAGGVTLAIGVAAVLGLSFAEKDAKRTAFATYPRDLRRFLDLCVRAKTVMPCSRKEEAPAAQPPVNNTPAPSPKVPETPAAPAAPAVNAPPGPKSALLKGLRFASFKRR